MSSALDRRFLIQHLEHINTITIHNTVMLDIYLRLPQIHSENANVYYSMHYNLHRPTHAIYCEFVFCYTRLHMVQELEEGMKNLMNAELQRVEPSIRNSWEARFELTQVSYFL